MKTKILIAAALILAPSIINQVYAGDVLLSPRAAQLQHELRKVPGTTPDLVDRSVKSGSPRDLAFRESLRKVPGTTTDMIVRGVLPASPRVSANEPWRLQQVQIAPLR